MFRSARIKLTLYYLLIIMAVSLLFSGVVYRIVSDEVERGVRRQAVRMMPLDDFLSSDFHDQIIVDAKNRIIFELVVINAVILITSGGLGFFLAGKTLEPISGMMEEQKHFVADASHEIRTPLTAIKTEIEVALRDKKLDLKVAKEILKSNLEEIDKLKMLSDYLLNMNKYQNLNNNLSFESFDVSEVVSGSVVSVKSLAMIKKIQIVSDISRATILGNKQSVFELSTILLDNAIKYSPENGKITVRVYAQKHHVIFSVEDNGVGIKSSELPHIFDRFFRADFSRSKDNVSGFGLGLSIAKNIVELNRGKIDVESVVGKGSKFTVVLPAVS